MFALAVTASWSFAVDALANGTPYFSSAQVAQGRWQCVAVTSGSSGGSIPLSGSTTIVIFGQ